MQGRYDLRFEEDEDRTAQANRGYWGNKLEFILACFGYSFSISAWTTFPYLCYRYGGITVFFVPFLMMLAHLGFPLLLQEMTLGQYSSQGALYVWRMCPLFQGVGVSILLLATVSIFFYAAILSWLAYYMYVSLTTSWKSCANSWNTDRCSESGPPSLEYLSAETCENRSLVVQLDGFCYYTNGTPVAIHDVSKFHTETPVSEYFSRYFAVADHWSASDFGISEVSGMKIGFLVLCWVAIAFCLFLGVKSYGKVVYITSTLPLLLLTAFSMRAATLPGATTGLAFLFHHDYSQLASPDLWYYAFSEVIVGLGFGYGGYMTLASYNRFRNFYPRDAFLVLLVHVIVKVMAAVTVFGLIGYLAQEKNTSIQEVVARGMKLLFVVVPDALEPLPSSTSWSFLFYFLVFLMVLGRVLTMMEVISTALCDLWQPFQRFRYVLVGVLSCVFFLFGILFCTPAGVAMMHTLDIHVHLFPQLIVICATSACVTVFYGICKLRHDIMLMLGDRSWWKVVLAGMALIPAVIHWFIIPLSSIVYLVFSAIKYMWFKYPRAYEYAGFSILGVILLPMVVCPIVLFIIACWRRKCTPVIQPSRNWGPQLSRFRAKATHLNATLDPETVECIQLEHTATHSPYLVFNNEPIADMFKDDQAPSDW